MIIFLLIVATVLTVGLVATFSSVWLKPTTTSPKRCKWCAYADGLNYPMCELIPGGAIHYYEPVLTTEDPRRCWTMCGKLLSDRNKVTHA